MYIGYSEEHEQLRRDLRSYYERLLTPEVEEGLQRGRGIGPVNREVVRQMGEDGWLGIGWPKEYGGQGRSAIEQFIFFDESMRAGAPVPMLTINTVGPTIMNFGTDEQKAEYLPRILKGELHFCIGYSEHDINQVFYDDVRVPASALVGGENNGWGLITNQLNHERVTLCSSGIIERALTDTRRWAQETKLADGRRVVDQEWVQVHLARVHARLEFLRLANWRVAWDATQSRLDVADASTT